MGSTWGREHHEETVGIGGIRKTGMEGKGVGDMVM